MPVELEKIVINTGPLIALERMGAMDLPSKLDIEFIAPEAVMLELKAGISSGHSAFNAPWLKTEKLKSPLSPIVLSVLDPGEASVIQLAIEQAVQWVCIDELKGRRIAVASGLKVTGALGLLGRAKQLGIIRSVKQYIQRATEKGVHYHPQLVERFLTKMGESKP